MSAKKFSDVNFYDVLSIEIDAKQPEIRRAYRRKALKCHPDKNPDNPKAAELFHELSRALEILTDATARSAYDKELKAKKAAELWAKQFEQRNRDAQHKPYTGQFDTTVPNLFLKIDKKYYEDQKSHAELKRPEIIDILASDGIKFERAKNLLYFQKPESYPLDLNKGFESYKFRYESYHNAGLSKIEEHLMKKDSRQCEADEKTQIYASRSVLYKLMIFPYPHRFDDEEIIYATKFDDVIYLCNGDINSDISHRQSKNDTHHFKFKQFCFSESPKCKPRTDVPINENIQNYCIYRSQMGHFDIVYSAELTGIQADEEISDPTNLEELNQCRFVMTKLLRQQHSWQKNEKVLNFWAQSYLANISDVYVGFKERGGIVLAPVQHAIVEDLPKYQKWKPEACIGFLHAFLKKIDETMRGVNCPYTVYELQLKTTQKCINYKINKGKTDKTFLSEKFINHLLKK